MVVCNFLPCLDLFNNCLFEALNNLVMLGCECLSKLLLDAFTVTNMPHCFLMQNILVCLLVSSFKWNEDVNKGLMKPTGLSWRSLVAQCAIFLENTLLMLFKKTFFVYLIDCMKSTYAFNSISSWEMYIAYMPQFVLICLFYSCC